MFPVNIYTEGPHAFLILTQQAVGSFGPQMKLQYAQIIFQY